MAAPNVSCQLFVAGKTSGSKTTSSLVAFATLFFAGLSIIPLGCEQQRPITGGTKSIVMHDGSPLEDVEVQVHRLADNSHECIARGVSGANGRFELIDPFGMGPVSLVTGQYIVTLASASPTPMVFPQEYSTPETSPIEMNWSPEQVELIIEVPLPKQVN